MISPQLILDVHDELIVDNFAGGGGASSGIEEALGRPVDHAINHDAEALGMHRINHPQTVHHPEDVFDVDPAKLAGKRRVGFGWFSPDCKHFSKAKGGKPLDKKIRGLVLVILRWAAIRTRVITMENVEEIQTYGPLLKSGKPNRRYKGRTWQAFLDALGPGLDPNHPDIPEMLELLRGTISKEQLVKGFGYDVEVKEIRACDLGTPTIRKRLFMIARCDGMPIVWPEETHAAPIEARSKRLQPYRIIAECIEWDRPCPSIFLTKAQARRIKCRRPLKRATLRRIATGVDRYVLKAKQPFIVSLTHQGGERCEAVTEPAKTLTGANRGEKALVEPSLAAPFIGDSNRPASEKAAPASEPMRTACAGVKRGHLQLVAPVLSRQFGESVGQDVARPGPTIMPGGQGKTALVAASMVQTGYGEREGQRPRALDIQKPLGTVVAGAAKHAAVAASLIKLQQNSIGQPVTKPVDTVMAGAPRFGVVATHLMKFQADSAGAPMDKPGPTVTANSYLKKPGGAAPIGLCAASMLKLRGAPDSHPSAPVDEPGHTSSAGGQHHGVNACYLAQHNGGFNTNPGHEATEQAEAVAPIMTELHVAGAQRVAKFLRAHGVKFEGDFATVCGFVIFDIGMRMLMPRELFRAQGFQEAYVIDRAWLINPQTGEIVEKRLTKEAQIRMCGNSVCPPVARAITAANVPELSIWNLRERREFLKQRELTHAA